MNIVEDKQTYIYGAGKYGVLAAFNCELKGIKVAGFIDRYADKIKTRLGLKVLPFDEVELSTAYIIIAVKRESFKKEIVDKLLQAGVEHNKNFEIFNPDEVHISDYKYTPKHRSSLKESKIGTILENWYLDNKKEIVELMKRFTLFKENYKKIPLDSVSNSSPHWKNNMIPPFDAISVYSFLAIYNPRYYVEVGSGNTTLFAAQSIRDNNLRTKIISIDPFPRREIDEICEKIYRVPLEDMNLDFFSELSDEDILLVDNSHRSFPNSDVTVFFTEILPKLPAGVLYTIHDIFLPFDYLQEWSSTQLRWYNEQYLLCSYIIGGASGDKIVCPNNFLATKKEVIDVCNSLNENCEVFEYFQKRTSGVFFWMRKG